MVWWGEWVVFVVVGSLPIKVGRAWHSVCKCFYSKRLREPWGISMFFTILMHCECDKVKTFAYSSKKKVGK